MIDLGPHWGFILGSWGITAAGVLALVGWIITDHGQVKRELAELEARGVRRRSDRRRQSEGAPGA